MAQADFEFRLGNVGEDFLKNNPGIAKQLGYKPEDAPLLMAVANRADILFQAPALAEAGEAEVYTIVAHSWDDVTDRIAATISKHKEATKQLYPPDTIIARLLDGH